MSIVLACKKDDVVYLAADTREIIKEKKSQFLSSSCCKIQLLDNDILLAVAGDRAVEQIIMAYPELFTLDTNGELSKKHIVNNIVPELYNVLNEHGLVENEEDKFPSIKAEIMLAYKSQLYQIDVEFLVVNHDKFLAIGQIEHTISTLMNIKEGEHPNDCLVRALDIDAKYNQCVARPYVLIDTKDKCFKYIGEDR